MWYYHPEAVIAGMAIPPWLPLLWGYTATLINQMGIWLSARVFISTTKFKTIQVIFFGALAGYFVLLYFKILWGILIAYAVGLLLIQIWRPDWRFVVTFTIACFIGPFGESFGIYLGIWQYLQRNYLLSIGGRQLNIPYSLPLAWGLATVMVYQMANLIQVRLEIIKNGQG